MRIIDETGIPSDEREHYAARPTVEAVRCDDGVTFAFKDQEPEEHTGPQVVVIDGNNYTPIAADIFDALYAPATAEQQIAADGTAPGHTAPPSTTTQVTEDSPVTVAGDNAPPETGSVTELTGDRNADTETAPAPDATQGDGGTPSVTGLTSS